MLQQKSRTPNLSILETKEISMTSYSAITQAFIHVLFSLAMSHNRALRSDLPSAFKLNPTLIGAKICQIKTKIVRSLYEFPGISTVTFPRVPATLHSPRLTLTRKIRLPCIAFKFFLSTAIKGKQGIYTARRGSPRRGQRDWGLG